jgi:MFS family permease
MVSTYTLLKFIHMAAAMIWIGGAVAITALTARLVREQDRGVLLALAQRAGTFGGAVLGPAAVLTLLAGIATTATVGFPFSSLWITWGFAGVLASIFLGATLIRRTLVEMAQIAATPGVDEMRLNALQRKVAGGIRVIQGFLRPPPASLVNRWCSQQRPDSWRGLTLLL